MRVEINCKKPKRGVKKRRLLVYIWDACPGNAGPIFEFEKTKKKSVG